MPKPPQVSPKRLKDSEGEGDSKVDGNKSNTGAKVNDVAGAELKAEAQESAPEGGQLTAEKVRAPGRAAASLNLRKLKISSMYMLN